MKALSTPSAPAAIGPYSQGIDAGPFVFVSGQLLVDPATGAIPDGAAAQVERAFANVRAILAAAGLGPEHVVKTTVFLSDLEPRSVLKKFKDKRFAAKCSREVILRGVELLGMDLPSVIALCIDGMRSPTAPSQLTNP